MATDYQTDQTLETEETDLLNDPNQQQNQVQDLSPSDESLLNTWVSLGLVGGMFYAKDRQEVWFSHDTLEKIDTQKLLDFNDTSYYGNIREAHRFSHKLLKEKVGSKYFMGQNDIKRRTHSLVIARRLHTKINNQEISIRTENTISRFGLELNDEGRNAFNKSIKAWTKEHPGEDINNGLITEGRKLFLKQNALEEKKLDGVTKDKLQKTAQQIKEDNKFARKQAIEANQKLTENGKKVIDDLLDPSKPTLTTKELQNKLVEAGLEKSTPILKRSEPQIITPIQPTTAPIIPSLPSSVAPPVSAPPPTLVPPGGFGGLFKNIKSFFGDFRKSIGGILGAAKTAITTIGTALATGGLSAALSLLKTFGLGLLKRIGKALLGDLGERISQFFESIFSPSNILKIALGVALAIVLVMILSLTGSSPGCTTPGTCGTLQQASQ